MNEKMNDSLLEVIVLDKKIWRLFSYNPKTVSVIFMEMDVRIMTAYYIFILYFFTVTSFSNCKVF